MIPDNVKAIPKNISSNQELIQEALGLGCTKAKVVLTQTISLGNWVKLHCQFGCSQYGKLLTCPPCTPDSEEMAEILSQYEKALLINANPDSNVQEIVAITFFPFIVVFKLVEPFQWYVILSRAFDWKDLSNHFFL